MKLPVNWRNRLAERWWWLALFCLVSLFVHVSVGYESRSLSFALKESEERNRAPAHDIEVTFAPAAPAPTIAPPPVKPKILKPEAQLPPRHAPVVRPPVVTRRIAPISPLRPNVVVAKSVGVPQPISERLTPRPAAVVRLNVNRALPAQDDRAPMLGRQDGDETVPTTEKLTLPPQTVKAVTQSPLPPALVPDGHGGGGGPPLPSIAIADPDAPAAGTRPDEGGSGAGRGGGSGTGVGRSSGAGSANGPGEAAGGSTRGTPFGDPNGVVNGDRDGGGYAGVPGAAGGGGLGGGGKNDAPVHIVYVLDVSGSMDDDGKIDKVRTALHKALQELRPDDSFGLITFSDRPVLYSSRLDPVTSVSVGHADLIIDSLKPDGGTNLSAAMQVALSMPGATQIFLMSDGEPNYGIVDSEPLRAFIRAHNPNHIIISTFALGLGEQFDGVQLLKNIAEENRGSYLYVNLHHKRRRLFH